MARAKVEPPGRGGSGGSGAETKGNQPVSEKVAVGWHRQGSGGGGSGGGQRSEGKLSAGGDAGIGSGGTTGDSKEVNLSVREARLWGKLSELRDLPAQDSLAAFPAGLGKKAQNTRSSLFRSLFISREVVRVAPPSSKGKSNVSSCPGPLPSTTIVVRCRY